MYRIYCVEDDENIRELIVYALRSSGFEAVGFEDGNEFSNALSVSTPDLILLDIMLPGEDGLQILERIRKNPKTKDIPIIIISAKTSEFDKVKGLDLGADDYITKPFGVMELISRVRALFRRTASLTPSTTDISYKDIVLDYEKRIVKVNGEPVRLTYKEFELLYYLLNNQGIVLTRNSIMNHVWGYDFEGESRTVDVHIRSLRQKLGKSGRIIKTVRNVGYKVGEDT
ncbi:MAG: response regulator transcription factor [Clostridiales bacterium]|nr:response regulator transcription factor [Clostridiales bacterium]